MPESARVAIASSHPFGNSGKIEPAQTIPHKATHLPGVPGNTVPLPKDQERVGPFAAWRVQGPSMIHSQQKTGCRWQSIAELRRTRLPSCVGSRQGVHAGPSAPTRVRSAVAIAAGPRSACLRPRTSRDVHPASAETAWPPGWLLDELLTRELDPDSKKFTPSPLG